MNTVINDCNYNSSLALHPPLLLCLGPRDMRAKTFCTQTISEFLKLKREMSVVEPRKSDARKIHKMFKISYEKFCMLLVFL